MGDEFWDDLADTVGLLERPDEQGTGGCGADSGGAAFVSVARSWTAYLAFMPFMPFMLVMLGYGQRAVDCVWRFLPVHSVRILCVLTLLVAFYTQTTSPTKCAFPSQVNAEYAEVVCSNHVFMYAEHGAHGEVLRYHSDIKYKSEGQNTRIPLTFYSFFPLAFVVMAGVCYLPQVLWKLLHLFGYGERFSAKQIGRLLQNDEREEIRTRCKEMKWHHKFAKIFIAKVFSLIIAAFCSVALYFVLFNPEKIGLIPLFHKEVLCIFRAQSLNEYMIRKVSCVLPQNFYNEQVCLLLLAWFVVVTIANIFSLVSWIIFVSRCYVVYMMGSLQREIEGVVGVPVKLLYCHLSYNEILSFLQVWDRWGDPLAAKYLRVLTETYCADNNIQLQDLNINGQNEPEPELEP